MNEKLPSREQALQLLRKNNCSTRVVRHCEAVAEIAVEIAENCKQKGLNVDTSLVEIGALLHDIGRSRTHTVHHAVVGAEIAQSAGLPEPVVSIIRRHVGGGITRAEAKKLGWSPCFVYVPKTLEEKIVTYSDKLVEKGRRVPIEVTMEKLSCELPAAAKRVRHLHDEITALVGEHA